MKLNYIIDFSLISIAFLSITVFFYRRQPKVPSMRNTLFGALLFLGVFFAVMDVLVVVIEPIAYMLPAWLVFIANAVFLMSVQLSSALFVVYCLVLTGFAKWNTRRVLVLSSIPFIITAIILLLPIGRGGIFYLDESNIYHRGELYAVLYANTALYLTASLAIVFMRRKRLIATKLFCICSFLFALFISMLIQYNSPELLLNAMANAFALTLIYHVLEAPSTHIDALTGVLNRIAFPQVVGDSYEQDRRSTLLIFPINALRFVNHSRGMAVGDKLLTEFAGALRVAFSDGYIFRIAGDVFAVLKTGSEYCDCAQAQEYLSLLPDSFRIGQAEVRPNASIACINSEDCDGAASMLAQEAYILQMNRNGLLGQVTMADEDIRKSMRDAEELERKLEDAVSAGRIEVFYQPLHDRRGVLSALEALVRIPDGEGGYLPTQESVELSERNGSIYRLSELVLRRVCEFVRDNNAQDWKLHHIGVNLSALQFIHEDLCQNVSAIMKEYGVDHSLISYEITETATTSISNIFGNMKRMNDAGFSFLMDDFGKGYANFNNIARLPLICVKIDKMLLWNAMRSVERMAFLKGIIDMLQTMGLTSVCEGVETAEQAALLQELGVDMLQGYYFSKPLPPHDLLRYVERMRADGQ